MEYTKNQIYEMMNHKKYQLSSKYDPEWILQNAMGSHCLWLQEALADKMHFTPDMRVLDMGCGKAISSIFLHREFGLQVWAVDLWNSPTENLRRIREMNCADAVFPIHADAHDLPFADHFFDSLVSINSFFFYAAEEDFLASHILRHVKPGGKIGIIVPSFLTDYSDGLPDAYLPYLDYGIARYHTCRWWANHIEKSGMVDIILADNINNNEGSDIYHTTARIFNAHEEPFNILAHDDITFTRIIARRKP